MTRFRTGLVLGKFLPPHAGHLYLVGCAKRQVERLYVLVESVRDEGIPVDLRLSWMRELAWDCEVSCIRTHQPQQPDEHPDFWEHWRATLLAHLPERPDLLFASEAYGRPLAKAIGATFRPVDPARVARRISATEIRQDPVKHWDMLPPPVRAHYARRVCLFGPESTGKTELAKRLADAFDTVAVPEYAETAIGWLERELRFEDLAGFAQAQVASEDELARHCRHVLLCDSDPLTTAVWSERLFGRVDAEVERLVTERRYDLTLLCDVDVPWVADRHRLLPEDRSGFFATCEAELRRAKRRYRVVRGDWGQRFEIAHRAVSELLAPISRA